MDDRPTRRDFVRAGALAGAGLAGGTTAGAGGPPDPADLAAGVRPFLTPARDFRDVSRGSPKPHSLTGAARAGARLTPDAWRLEVTADPFTEEPHTRAPATLERPLTLAGGNALTLAGLRELGRGREVHFLKAMQCLNIDAPLGQGLWTGVPLRDVLRACGRMDNVRRVYFWGYHNHDPKQVFASSVSYSHALEPPPGELPVFLAHRLNGEPIPPERGGPVRMVVPWSHGYKSIKWLQHVFVTNDPRNNDTYAHGNNDPESYLKTAAYLDPAPAKVAAGAPLTFTGQVVCGPSGLKRVEYWLREVRADSPALADDAPELLRARWLPCSLQRQPDWARILPAGIRPHDVLGFDRDRGTPLAWPLRYSACTFAVTLRGLAAGRYEVRARAVDLNDFAQPEPRPSQKSGKNAVPVRRFEVA